MGFLFWVAAIGGILFAAAKLAAQVAQNKENAKRSKTLGAKSADIARYGALKPQMVCPHCQTKGKVFRKSITKKVGVSGAKAIGAVLTGGVSVLATGLSRKDNLTEAHCTNCSSTWHF